LDPAKRIRWTRSAIMPFFVGEAGDDSEEPACLLCLVLLYSRGQLAAHWRHIGRARTRARRIARSWCNVIYSLSVHVFCGEIQWEISYYSAGSSPTCSPLSILSLWTSSAVTAAMTWDISAHTRPLSYHPLSQVGQLDTKRNGCL